MKFIFKVVILAVMAAAMLTACGKANTGNKAASDKKSTAVPAASQEIDPQLIANTDKITITLADGDVIKAELYPDLAPITVANFENLVNEHFYDGLIFHRVISGFMIQGGGYDVNGNEKAAASIKGEFAANGVKNDLKHTKGVLSMARTSVPDSASSQFFIMHKDSPHLDGQYAAFGKVTEGIEVVDKIAGVQTDSSDKPVTPVVIQSITMDE